jgi:CheY-like chemotaxis protein
MEKKRILIVDDELGSAKLLQANLEQTGRYLAQVEHRPECALEAARAFKPHLIILDLIMPGMSGRELAAQVIADPQCKEAAIVFLTAATSQLRFSKCDAKPTDYPSITKPASLNGILNCIEQALLP